jgi:hypothetical protein
MAGSPLAEARLKAADAATWIMFALGKLEAMRAVLSKATIKVNAIETALFVSANTHFHLDYVPPNADKAIVERTRSRIGQLITAYKAMASVIANHQSEFVEDLADNTAFAKAVQGGNTSGTSGDKKIRFCPPYLTIGPLFRTAVIVHECAHYVDKAIGHFASELPFPKGTPVDSSSKNYAQLNFDEARKNAYSYAQFALHSFMNFDKRLNFPND